MFLEPPPDEAALRGSYYHDADFTELLLGELRETTFERAREKLALLRRAGLPRAGTSLLDVGASSGAWLQVAAGHGLNGVGVELGAATAAAACANGLDVRAGTLAETFPAGGRERFDLITFWDVLEHLRDPIAELRRARRLLTPGGIVTATFPNVAGWYPRASRRLLTPWTGVWEYPEIPVHLYDFAPRTAERLFACAGLTTVFMRTFATPFPHYRSTTLSSSRLGRGPRGRLARVGFEALRAVVYPAATLFDAGNSLFVVAAA